MIGFGATTEPCVLFAGVTGDQVEQDVHAAFVCLVKQCDQIGVRTVSGGYASVVAHIIAGIFEGGIEAGIQPNRIASKVLNVTQTGGDSGDVADAIAVRVGKGLRIDLIEHGGIEPCRPGVRRAGIHGDVSPWKDTACLMTMKISYRKLQTLAEMWYSDNH